MEKEIYKDKNIDNLINSDEFVKLKEYYEHETIFDILGTTTNENIHSNFLKWIFDSKSSHLLGDKPLKKLLELLIKKDVKTVINDEKLKECVNKAKYKISMINIKREEKTFDSKGRIDLFINFKLEFENKKYNMVIILENKIDSGINVSDYRTQKKIDDLEGQKLDLSNYYVSQLIKYKDYAEKIKKVDPNCNVILAFLSPEYNIPKKIEKEYVFITYQDIVNSVLEPCISLFNEDNNKAKNIIEDYICNISKTRMYKNVIAIGSYEDKLVSDIYDNANHKKALEYIFESLDSLFNNTNILSDEQKEACSCYSNNIQILKPIFKILANKNNKKYFDTSKFKNKNNCYRIDGGDLLNRPELIKKIVDKIEKFSDIDKKEKIINYTGKMLPLYINKEEATKIEKNLKWYEDYGENKILVSYYPHEIDSLISFLNDFDNGSFKIERYK